MGTINFTYPTEVPNKLLIQVFESMLLHGEVIIKRKTHLRKKKFVYRVVKNEIV